MNLQVSGTLAGIEARNGGWFAVHVQEEGRQYPSKLSTKKPDLLQLAQSLIGQQVTALYNESESTNINPNSGQPYINRYLEALSLGTAQAQYPYPMPPPAQPIQQMQQQPVPQYTPPPQAQPVQQQPQYTPPPANTGDALREQKIHRQSASKVAVALLPLLDAEHHTLSALLRISEQLVRYYDEGVQWQAPPVPQPQWDGEAHDAQQQQQHQQAQDQPPPPTDDDIPF